MQIYRQNRILSLLLFLTVLCFSGFSQETEFGLSSDIINIPTLRLPQDSTANIQSKALIAMAATDYPVTPGDVYTLQYLQSNQAQSLALFVENDYMINLSIFGVLDARGLTYSELKKQIESIVVDAYPNSSPQILLKSPGAFNVLVKGEVKTAQFAGAWGLSTLGEVVRNLFTEYSSGRTVEIVSSDGTSKRYDLFLASREGDISQNPYVRPGDTIIVHEADRIVRVEGEVRRPGVYELLPGDDLEDLLTYYGNGYTTLGDRERIVIRRWNAEEGEYEYGKTLYVNANKGELSEIDLYNHDIVAVPSKEEELPVVLFKGAITVVEEESNGNHVLFSQTLPHQFNPGERLSTAVMTIIDKLSPIYSDIENAYIVHEGETEKKFINLKLLLEHPGGENDIVLQPNDTIVIPFKQMVVLVGGEVQNPGQYPYLPNRTWDYYVGLAGGFDQENHIGKAVVIRDVDNNRKKKTDIIEPEDKIIAPINHPLYYIDKWALPVTVASSVIALIVSIFNLIDLLDQTSQ